MSTLDEEMVADGFQPAPPVPPSVVDPSPVVDSLPRDYTTGDLWGAAFQSNNIVGSAISSKALREGLFPTDLTPITSDELNELIGESNLGEYADRFLDVETRGQANAVRDDIIRELENKDIMDAAGFWPSLGVNLVAGVVDLPTLLPFGMGIKLAGLGKSTAAVATRMAVAGGVDAAVSEVALHSTQQTRTFEESVANIGGSVLLTSALGTAIVKGMETEVFQKFAESFKKTVDTHIDPEKAGVKERVNEFMTAYRKGDVDTLGELVPKNPHGGPRFDDPADTKYLPGWKAEPVTVADDFIMVDSAKIGALSKGIQRVLGGNPILDLITAKAKSAREFIVNLEAIPAQLKGEFRGQATPVAAAQLRAKLDGEAATAIRGVIDTYRKWRGASLDLTGRGMQEFSRRVSQALASGDESSTPEIQTAIKAARKFFTEHFEARVKAGLIRRQSGEKYNPKSESPPTGPEGPSAKIVEDRIPVTDDTGRAGPPSGPKAAGEGVGTDVPQPKTPRLSVRESVIARADSPENMSVDEFINAARAGIKNVGRTTFRKKKRGNIEVRDGELLDKIEWLQGEANPKVRKTEPYPMLKQIDGLLIEGRPKNEIAAEVFHSWAMRNDPKYAQQWVEFQEYGLLKSLRGKKSPEFMAEARKALPNLDELIAKAKRIDPKKPPRRPTIRRELAQRAHEALEDELVNYSISPNRGFDEFKMVRDDAPEVPVSNRVTDIPDPEDLRKARTKLETDWIMGSESLDWPNPYFAPNSFYGLVQKLPDDINDRFQVHGISPSGPAKSYEEALFELLISGIDPKRTFHSGPPKGSTIGGLNTKNEKPYLILSDPDQMIDKVKHVVVNGPAAENIKRLRGAFPDVNFMTADEAIKFMKSGELPNPPKEKFGPLGQRTGGPVRVERPMRFQPPEIEPQTYFPHVYRSDTVMPQKRQFVRDEAEAAINSYKSPLTGKTFDQLTKPQQRAVARWAFDHAKGVYNAIVFEHDLNGRALGAKIESTGNRRGANLERNVFQTTKQLMQRGYIEDDILLVMNTALRTTGTDAALAMKFRRPKTAAEEALEKSDPSKAYWLDGDDPTTVPDLDMSVYKERIKAEYDDLIDNAGTDLEIAFLRMESDRILRHVDDSTRMLRGTYYGSAFSTATAGKIAGGIKDFIFSTMMGNIVVSSIPDTANLIRANGLGRTVGYTVKAAMMNVAEITSLIKGGKFSDTELAELRRTSRAMGVAIETEIAQRLAGLADVHDPFSQASRDLSVLGRTLRQASFVAGRAFGAVYWNNAMQRFGNGLFQDRIAELALNRAKRADKYERQWLNNLGATDEFLDRLASNLIRDQHSTTFGVHRFDPSGWDDDFKTVLYAMAQKNSKNVVINPSVLEKPKWNSTPLGSVALSLTGYVFGSTMRVMAQTANRVAMDKGVGRDAFNMYAAIGAMLALGALTPVLRAIADDKMEELPDFEENPGWWFYEAADRGGLLGLFGHISNLVGRVNPTLGLRPFVQWAAGDEDTLIGSTAKSIPASFPEAAAGPAASVARNLGTVVFDTLGTGYNRLLADPLGLEPVDRQIDGGTVRALRRLTPMADGMLWRQLTNEAERYITEDILLDSVPGR